MENSTYILDDSLLATNTKRFLNYILDIVFIYFSIFVVSFFVSIIANLSDFTSLSFWLANMSVLEGQCLFIIVSILYYTILEFSFGRSLGKFITGTIVVDENGQQPSLGVIFKRSMCRLIPFDGLSFIGSSGRGWHDSISDTYVVETKALDEDKKTFYDFKMIGVQETDA